jgi:hypothetical protein
MAAWAAQDCLFRGIRDRVVEGQRGAEVVSWAGMYEWQVQIERELNRRKEARHPSCWEAALRLSNSIGIPNRTVVCFDWTGKRKCQKRHG